MLRLRLGCDVLGASRSRIAGCQRKTGCERYAYRESENRHCCNKHLANMRTCNSPTSLAQKRSDKRSRTMSGVSKDSLSCKAISEIRKGSLRYKVVRGSGK